jgi:predicted ATPase
MPVLYEAGREPGCPVGVSDTLKGTVFRDPGDAMIHRARFQNFKALKDVEITFDSRLTVLVGPNGSGKSSVLRGIYWLCQMAGTPHQFRQATALVSGMVKETYSGKGEDQLFELLDEANNGKSGIRFQTHPDSQRVYPDSKSNVAIYGTGNWLCQRIINSDEILVKPQSTATPPSTFTPAEFVELRPDRVSKPSLTTTTPPPIGSDGTGLASLMAYFKLYDEPRYDQVVELFQIIIPQVQRIRIDRVPADQQGPMGEGLIFDLPSRNGVPASAMSDGTLYALGLIVKILDPQRPKTLLIDNIDHGFHPKAQLTLVELLHKLLDEIPDLQIIATSHSPYILDRLQWNEVRVTSLRDDGSSVVARLEDHPDFDRWKDSMSPGEFWSTFYEEWAVKSKPALQPVP